MAASTVQLNTRIDKSLKQGGDSVFARYGLSPSDVVRAVWRYAAEHQEPPSFMLQGEGDNGVAQPDRRLVLAREGRGLAVSLAEKAGVRIDRDLLSDDAEWSRVRDDMYDELDLELQEACR